MAVREEREEDGRDVRPPATIWMLLSVPVLVVAMVGFLSLFSYDASDIGRVVAPANEQAVNWMGSLGAWSAHGLYALFGFGAYGVPLVLFISGAMMLARVRIGLRGFWMGLSVFCVSALLQFANTAVSSLIEGGRYNFAPHAGGGFGYLLNDLTFSRWIGVPGTAVLYSLLWVVCVVMVIGPAAIMDYFFVLCAREREIARQVEEMEDEADAGEVRRKARAEARARARAEKQAQAEQTQAAREQARLERVAVETEREVNRKLWWKRFWKEAEVEEEPEAEQTVENAVAVEVRTAAPERPKRVRRVEVVVPTASQSSTTSGGAGEPDGIPVAVETNEKPTTKARPVAVSAPVAAPTPVAAPAPAPVASARLTPAADGVHKPALTSSFVPNEVTFKLPTTRLLHEPPEVVEEGNQAELEERKEMIMNTLAEFGIHVGVTGVVIGRAHV